MDEVLQNIFLDLYSIVCVKDVLETDSLELSNDSPKWNVSFIIVVHDWEVDAFASFFNLLYSFRLRQKDEDKLLWDSPKRGKFGIRLFYNKLVPHNSTLFPLKSILQNKFPLKMVFFAWTTTQEKILTMDNPRKQHVIVVD